jgi:hypothetical protein
LQRFLETSEKRTLHCITVSEDPETFLQHCNELSEAPEAQFQPLLKLSGK